MVQLRDEGERHQANGGHGQGQRHWTDALRQNIPHRGLQQLERPRDKDTGRRKRLHRGDPADPQTLQSTNLATRACLYVVEGRF